MKDGHKSLSSKSYLNLKSGESPALGGQQKISRPKLGQLLIDAGLLEQPNFQHALLVSEESKQPLGRILVGLGYVTQAQLESALLAQSRICDGSVVLADAISAIRESSRCGIDIEVLFRELNSNGLDDDGKLGGLLTSAGLISEEAYEVAKSNAEQSGLLLGRTLILTQGITNALLDAALSVMVLIRDNILTRQQGVMVLRHVRERRMSVRDSLKALRLGDAYVSNHVRIGELLCRGKMVSEQECLWSVETALMSKRSFGAVLTENGFLSPSQLDDALTLQASVNSCAISAGDAADVFTRAKASNLAIWEMANSMGVFRETTQDADGMQLCLQAHITEPQTIQVAIDKVKPFEMDASKACLVAGFMRQEVFKAAIKLQEMRRIADLDEKEAIVALTYCDQNNVDPEVALAKLGYVAKSIDAENEQNKKFLKVFVRTITACVNELRCLAWLAVTLVLSGILANRCLHIEPFLVVAVGAVILALLQKLPKFLNCGQLFDNRPRWQPKKDADRVQGFFGFHVRI